MITQNIVTFFVNIGKGLLGLFPVIPASLPQGIASALGSVFQGIGYVIPFWAILPILALSFLFDHLKIFWAIALRLKSFVPFWGN